MLSGWSFGCQQRVLQELADQAPDHSHVANMTQKSRLPLAIICVVLGMLLLAYILGLGRDAYVLMTITLSGLYLIRGKLGLSTEARDSRLDARISYALPLVVEELVMAVRSGHDVYAAIKLIAPNDQALDDSNPVYNVFAKVIQQVDEGFSLESVLRKYARTSSNTALRHTLMHLAVAHRDGGGLLFALSELADATQTFYEDKIEEGIAGLPVKATLPLVLIFAGVLMLFMTPPILQVVETTLQPVVQ